LVISKKYEREVFLKKRSELSYIKTVISEEGRAFCE